MSTRHSFRKSNLDQKNDLIIELTAIVASQGHNAETNQKLFDIIDYYAENSPLGYLATKRILTIFFQENVHSSGTPDEIKAKIDAVLIPVNNMANDEHVEDYHNSKQLVGIVNEMQQIEAQAKELMGKSVRLTGEGDIGIITFGQDAVGKTVDTIDAMEIVDLGSEMDEDPILLLDENDQNYRCVFCESNNIIVISTTEGYCSDCHRNFLIQKKSTDGKKSVLIEV